MKEDENLRLMVKGLINRQRKCINIDFYANAFNKNPTGYSNHGDTSYQIVEGKLQDRTQDPRIWERKWEVDSIASHLKLINQYIHLTADSSVLQLLSLQKIILEL